MTLEDIHHLRTVDRAAGCGNDYFGSLAEVRRSHDGRAYDSQLFHILAAEIVEPMHCATRNA
jgi:hypothetical protein